MPESELDLPNQHIADGGVLSAGQPSRANLEAASRAGARTVVNLRLEGEFAEFDEAGVAADLGLRYVHIPIGGAPDLTLENAQALHRALSAGMPAIVHCGSGNRVGALFAVRARYIADKSVDQALQIGVDAGLDRESSLFAATREALEQAPADDARGATP